MKFEDIWPFKKRERMSIGSSMEFLEMRTRPKEGHFRAYDGDGNIIVDKKNMIVNGSRSALAHLIAEAQVSEAITTIEIGTEGHEPGDPYTPVSPTISDTALEDVSPFSKALEFFTYLPIGVETSVMFTFNIEKAEGNGSGIVLYTEAGLFTSGDTMFARNTFPAIVKTADRKIVFEWTIVF